MVLAGGVFRLSRARCTVDKQSVLCLGPQLFTDSGVTLELPGHPSKSRFSKAMHHTEAHSLSLYLDCLSGLSGAMPDPACQTQPLEHEQQECQQP